MPEVLFGLHVKASAVSLRPRAFLAIRLAVGHFIRYVLMKRA